jgi:hypothetical protein
MIGEDMTAYESQKEEAEFEIGEASDNMSDLLAAQHKRDLEVQQWIWK